LNAFEPTIIAFLCNWCAYDGADAAGRARLTVPDRVREVRVMCSGQVAPGLVLKAFESGADGVMVLGCKPGDCHYKTGNAHALKRMSLIRALMAPTSIHPQRLRIDWVSAGEGDRFAQIAEEMVITLRTLGPIFSPRTRQEY
jgi:F420-non-reducing hydrogenase iron-sulfur subunit